MTNYSDKPDYTLVELTLLGNDQAYGELVTRHEKAVKGTAYKITGNTYSAEDASQDAFVAAWMKLDSLSDYGKFRAWVCSIARNTAVDLVRRYNATENISLDTGLLSSDIPDCAWEDIERAGDLRDAVARLSEKIREVVELHYFEGYSTKEIAHRLSLPEGTVTWRLSEGRRQLRKGYGIMDKAEYNENEALVTRVLREVEQLKLWRLKNDKTGFETEYEAVLKSVENLDDSKEKSHALADVMLMGYWWLPGEKSDETIKRIKESAEKGRNENVLMDVMAHEFRKISGKDRIDYMLNTQIPYLIEQDFKKTQAYVWYWAGAEYLQIDIEKAEECFEKAKSLLSPIDVYYAGAVSALQIVRGYTYDEKHIYSATGELFRLINGKYYFWLQPGVARANAAVFFYASRVDGLLFDDSLKVGETRTASDGTSTLTLVSKEITVETYAGKFNNCRRFLSKLNFSKYYGFGPYEVETDYAEGVGIIRQKVVMYPGIEWFGNNYEVILSSYLIKGGDGFLPFAEGNRWEYLDVSPNDGYRISEDPHIYEIVGMNNDSVNVTHSYCHENVYDLEGFAGNMLFARQAYFNWEEQKVIDVLPYIEKAKKLAATKREKLLSNIAYDVMYRILHTNPEFDHDYSQYGRWNFFDCYRINRTSDEVIPYDTDYHFELKDMSNSGDDGFPVLHSFLYDMLSDATEGYFWKNEWIPGAHFDKELTRWDVGWEVTIDIAEALEKVTTPAGTFDDCIKLTFDQHGLSGGHSYRGGIKYYWFAPGVGIVQMKAPYNGDHISHWALSEYKGTGNGYFPVADGLFRRYDAQGLKGGYHGSVEYTFLEDEQGIALFRNALGTQDRDDYEKLMEEKKKKEAEKEKAEQAEEQKSE